MDVLGGDRSAVVGREMTKKFEEFVRGPLSSIADAMKVVRGEVVVLIEGARQKAPPTEAEIEQMLLNRMEDGLRPSVAAKTVAKELGCTRDEVYKIGLKIKQRTH